MIDFANKCGRNVIYVCKFIDELKGVCIYCKFKDKEYDSTEYIETPWLGKHMFKGLEVCKNYTLEDLELENVNG